MKIAYISIGWHVGRLEMELPLPDGVDDLSQEEAYEYIKETQYGDRPDAKFGVGVNNIVDRELEIERLQNLKPKDAIKKYLKETKNDA